MTNWRALCAVSAVGLISALAGCVSTKQLDEDAIKSLKGGGAAVLRVAFDRDPELGEPETYVVAARVHRVTKEGTSRARLVRSSDGTYFATTLGGRLEPGKYWVYGLETAWGGQSKIHYFDYDSLQFDVRPDSISVIGTLILSRDGTPPVLMSPQADPSEQWVGQTFPAIDRLGIKPDFAPGVSTTFRSSRKDLIEAERRLHAKVRWIQLASGDFAAPGRLGTVLYRRNTSSHRSSVDLGAASAALFVSSFRGGLLAGGEEGLLRFSPDGKTGWRALRAPTRGALHAIQPIADGKFAALVRSGVTWSVHLTSDLFGGEWSQLASFDFSQFQNPLWQPIPFVLSTPERFSVIHFDGSYRAVDLPGGQVQSFEPSDAVRNIITAPDGTMALRTRVKGENELSFDGGATWSKLELPPSSVFVSLVDRQTIFLIVHEGAGPASPSGFAVYVSRNAGQQWSRTGTAPIALGQAKKFWAMSQSRLQIELTNGDVLESVDAATSWTRLQN